jgi:hypothetical protein
MTKWMGVGPANLNNFRKAIAVASKNTGSKSKATSESSSHENDVKAHSSKAIPDLRVMKNTVADPDPGSDAFLPLDTDPGLVFSGSRI